MGLIFCRAESDASSKHDYKFIEEEGPEESESQASTVDFPQEGDDSDQESSGKKKPIPKKRKASKSPGKVTKKKIPSKKTAAKRIPAKVPGNGTVVINITTSQHDQES